MHLHAQELEKQGQPRPCAVSLLLASAPDQVHQNPSMHTPRPIFDDCVHVSLTSYIGVDAFSAPLRRAEARSGLSMLQGVSRVAARAAASIAMFGAQNRGTCLTRQGQACFAVNSPSCGLSKSAAMRLCYGWAAVYRARVKMRLRTRDRWLGTITVQQYDNSTTVR